MNLKICMLLCCVGTLNAAPVALYGQQMDVSFKNERLVRVLDQLKSETGYQFFYQKGVVSENQRISLTASNVSFEDVLDKILIPNGYVYEIIDNKIIVVNRMELSPQPSTPLVMVSGVVKGQDGKPLPGVTVVLENNTRVGAVTDALGIFSIMLESSENAKFVFKYLGKKTRVVVLEEYRSENGFRPLDIILEDQTTDLGEVVVTGYQTISKERATGSYAIVDGETLTRQYSSDIVSGLEGKVAGVVKSGGDMVIRGTSTFNANSDPLYVIDGFPVEGDASGGRAFVSRLNTGMSAVSFIPPNINPKDIESITILKDAAAASIYGARAANGVVVIVTKKAVKGDVRVNFSMDYNYTPVYEQEKMNRYLTPSQYIDMQEQFVYNNTSLVTTAQFSSWRSRNKPSPTLDLMLQVKEGLISQEDADREIAKYRYDNYPLLEDLRNELLRPVQSQRYTISVGKATDGINTMASVTYNRSNGQYKSASAQNLDISLRNNIVIAKWLDIDLNASAYIQESKSSATFSAYAGMSESNVGLYTRIVDEQGQPIARPFYATRDIQIAYEANKDDLESLDIILQDEVNMNIMKDQRLTARGLLRLNFKITDWLKFSSGINYDAIRGEVSTRYEKESYDMRYAYDNFSYRSGTSMVRRLPYGDSHALTNATSNNYTFRNQIDFNYRTKDNLHSIVAIAGSEVRESKSRQLSTRNYGYDSETLTQATLDLNNLTTASNSIFGTGAKLSANGLYQEDENLIRFVSWYSNASYSYKGTYNFTGSIRWDLSDLFGQNAKYLYKPLWSVGAGWNITNEEFMRDVAWLDRLGLRATYGINGNIAKDVSPYLIAKYTTSSYTGNSSASIATPPNADLRWERTGVFNLGLDFAVLKNRLQGSLEYYSRNSTDLLSPEDIDPTYGFTNLTLNVGEMTNKGVELTLNGVIIDKNDIRWTAGFTMGYNKNRVTKYSGTPKQASDLYVVGGKVEGRPLRNLFSYKYVRIDENGDAVILDENGEEVTTASVTSVDALLYSGTTTPRFTGGLNSAFNYKGFELAFNFVYYAGHVKTKPGVTIHIGSNTGPDNRMSTQYLNAWQEAGDENKSGVIPRITWYYEPTANVGSRATNWQYSDQRIVDAGYVKLRNLSLRYMLDSKLLKRVGIKTLTLRAQANNLFSIAAYNGGYDPETGYYINTPSYSFGINVTF